MQPYAIRKNRTYSLPAKFFFATLATTAFVVIIKNVLIPISRDRKSQRGIAFEQEYFSKLEQMKIEKAISAAKEEENTKFV